MDAAARAACAASWRVVFSSGGLIEACGGKTGELRSVPRTKTFGMSLASFETGLAPSGGQTVRLDHSETSAGVIRPIPECRWWKL